MPCEGKKIRVRGSIDWANVFFREEYPQLPYDKFKIYDRITGKAIEVWVIPETAGKVYPRIQQQKSSGKEVFVKGTIAGFDMPVMGKCSRAIKLELETSEYLEFH